LLANVEAFHPHDQGKLSDALKLLGRVLLDRHELPEACERCEQALGIDEVLHGQDHLTVGFDLNTLGCVLLAQQKWENVNSSEEVSTDYSDGTAHRSDHMPAFCPPFHTCARPCPPCVEALEPAALPARKMLNLPDLAHI